MWNFNYFKTALIVCLLCIIGRGSALAQTYTKVNFDDLVTGDVIVIVDQTSAKALPNDQTSNPPTATPVTFVSDADKTELTASAVTENLKWVVTKNSDGSCSFTSNSVSSNMLYMINDSKGMKVGSDPSTTSKPATNTFTFESNKLHGKGNATRYVGVYNKSNWRCYATATDTNIRGQITAFYKMTADDGLTPVDLSFSQTDYTLNIGEAFTEPTLNGIPDGSGLTATYSIVSNPDGAISIDETTGKVTINAAGTATITATTPETETYKAGTASYTLKVVDPNQKQATYTKITSVDEIEVGAQYIVVNEKNKVALGLINSSNNGDCVAINITEVDGNNVATVESENDVTNPYEITLAGTADRYALQTAQCPKGIGWEGKTGNKLSTTTNTGWTISFTTQKNVTIANTADGNNFICYNATLNSNKGGFRAYKPSSTGVLVVQLYKKDKPVETGTHSIGVEGYATFYSEKAYKMPAGVTGGIVTETKATDETCGTLTIEYNYPEGSVVPAKTALLWKGEKNDYTFEYTTTEEPAPEGNMLHGADAVNAEGKTEVAGENVKYYILSHNSANVYGFFWAAADGKAVAYQAPYAFLAIDFGTTGLAPKIFSLDGNGGTTGITNVETTTNNVNGKIFSVTGAYVGTDKTRLPKGIYLIDGKKIAIK